MTRVIVLAWFVCATTLAHADVFDARRVTRLEDVVWALTATCAEHGDDTQRRQCRQLRDARHKELVGQPWLVEGDATAFVVGAFDPMKKSAPVSLSGCVYCGAIAIEGKSFQIYSGPPRVEAGKIVPPALHDSSQTFASPAAHAAFKQKTASARVDFVIKLGDKRTSSAGGKSGLLVEVIGYRVVVPCTGEVVLAKPASGPVAADNKTCTK